MKKNNLFFLSLIIFLILLFLNCPAEQAKTERDNKGGVILPTGALDTSFNPGTGASNEILSLALQSDGKILIGGRFTSYNDTQTGCLARLNNNGSLDTSFNQGGTGADTSIWEIAVQSDSKILIGGQFLSYNGTGEKLFTRLDTDGTSDSTFNQDGTGVNSTVLAIVLQPDNKILIGGLFTTYNEIGRNRIARLDTNGSLDTSFTPGTGANDTIEVIALQPDNKILIAGYFTSYNGVGRNYIARLNSNGSLDTSFNPGTGANADIWAMTLQSDGKILIGGNFTSFNGTVVRCIARLNSNGTLDTTFITDAENSGPGVNDIVYTIILQSDGKILIGGNFTLHLNWFINPNFLHMPYIGRLNSNGAPDTSFNQGGTGLDGKVYSIIMQPDGKMLIGGNFTSYNGTGRHCIARIK